MKKNLLKRVIAMSVSAVMVFSATAFANAAKPEVPENPIQFPLEKEITLTFWDSIASAVSNLVVSLDETPLFKELNARTNVKLKFIHPQGNAAAAREQFNLLVASGDVPDIIGANAGHYTGGKVNAYSDGVIIDVLPYVEEYMPNLNKILTEYPVLNMDVLTTEGEMLGVPAFRYAGSYPMGIYYRDDWAEELGIDPPETIEEFYEMLVAFKDIENVTAPFCLDIAMLRDYAQQITNAYGIGGGTTAYYVDDQVVKYYPVEDAYKDYLKEMAKWYAEGLIEPEIVSITSDMVDSKITSGQAGAGLGYAGGDVGRYKAVMVDEEFSLGGVQPLSLKKGEVHDRMSVDRPTNTGGILCISATNPYIEETLAFLDYGFTTEGHMLYNFGIEGESYEMVDGEPVYTEYVTNNPDGLPMSSVLGIYTKASTSGPMIQDQRYYDQYQASVGTLDVIKPWSLSIEPSILGQHIYYGTLTSDQSDSIVEQQTAITTYKNEMYAKMLTGAVDIDATWDTYIKEIFKMGLQDILDLRQEVYDNFVETWPEVLDKDAINLQDYIVETYK